MIFQSQLHIIIINEIGNETEISTQCEPFFGDSARLLALLVCGPAAAMQSFIPASGEGIDHGLYILSVPKFSANLYCICLSKVLRYT